MKYKAAAYFMKDQVFKIIVCSKTWLASSFYTWK